METGTWLTRDPIGYEDGPNIYCYVHCNPITHFDAFGLYEYDTDNLFVATMHELNPFNMDGSFNNQVSAGFSLLMGDTASAMEMNGLAQLQDLGASQGIQDVYMGSLAVSFNAVSVATGSGLFNASGGTILAAETYGMTQSAALGGSAPEIIAAGGTSVLLSSVTGAGDISVPAQNMLSSAAGNTAGQLSTGTPISELNVPSIMMSGGAGWVGGNIMGLGGTEVMNSMGTTVINNTEAYAGGILSTWLYDTWAQGIAATDKSDSFTEEKVEIPDPVQVDDTLSDSASTP